MENDTRQFLTFKDVSIEGQKTKRYAVFSTHNGDHLAYVVWDTGWRRYVLDVPYRTKWSVECLAQAYKFIQKLMNEREVLRSEPINV